MQIEQDNTLHFEVIDLSQVPPLTKYRRANRLLDAVRELPNGKALKIEFATHERARRQQRSILTNPNFSVTTQKVQEQDRYYLYIWKKKGERW